MFHNVSKVVVCDRPNTFASFSEDGLHFSRQAQHFADLNAWQAQHFTGCRVACFLRIALAALRQVVTTLQSWAGGVLVDPRRGPVEPKEAKQQFRDFRRPGIWTALIITTPPDVTPEIDLHPEVKILSCGQYSFPCCSWKGRKKAW